MIEFTHTDARVRDEENVYQILEMGDSGTLCVSDSKVDYHVTSKGALVLHNFKLGKNSKLIINDGLSIESDGGILNLSGMKLVINQGSVELCNRRDPESAVIQIYPSYPNY